MFLNFKRERKQNCDNLKQPLVKQFYESLSQREDREGVGGVQEFLEIKMKKRIHHKLKTHIQQ